MSDELLEEYIKQYIQGTQSPLVTFTWHGGEPLLAGIAFYKKALIYQKKHARGKKIENTLQTNGLLINEEWCRFWRNNSFLIGISIDGPADIHDSCRQDRLGRKTFSRVMQGIELMRKYHVEFNTLSTINAQSAGRGLEVYRFLKSIGSHYMQFLPVVEYVLPSENPLRSVIVPPHTEGALLAKWSIDPLKFGEFMSDIFDEWVRHDVGEYYVQLFDVSLANWVGAPPGLCAFAEHCGGSLVVEHNGDVYSCDHFVYQQYCLGNIKERSLQEMAASPEQLAFGKSKQLDLPNYCKRCDYYKICHGECPKHRFDVSPDGETGLNVLCRGFRYFFKHITPYMNFMAYMLKQNKAPALVMPWAQMRDNQRK